MPYSRLNNGSTGLNGISTFLAVRSWDGVPGSGLLNKSAYTASCVFCSTKRKKLAEIRCCDTSTLEVAMVRMCRNLCTDVSWGH